MRTTTSRGFVRGALVCALALAAWQSAGAIRQEPTARVEAMREFTAGMARYVALRARFEERLPSFDDPRRDSWSVMLTRRYLASAIRAARPRAAVGDILTPPVAAMFRTIISDAIYEVDIEGLVDGDLYVGEAVIDLTVNEPVPAWAMERVPAALLARLPALPDAIEYRVVGGSFILWDSYAEILIDAIPGAFRAD